MATKKKVTLNEFKAWLDGIEEMQSPDWTPDLKQWRLIRNKIRNIVETKAAPAQTQPTQAINQYGSVPVNAAPVSAGLPPMPPPTSTAFDGFDTTSAAAPQMSKQNEGTIKTPDSNTNDASSFI